MNTVNILGYICLEPNCYKPGVSGCPQIILPSSRPSWKPSQVMVLMCETRTPQLCHKMFCFMRLLLSFSDIFGDVDELSAQHHPQVKAFQTEHRNSAGQKTNRRPVFI